MSCNISIPLQRIIDDVAEVLAGNYISVDNPFLNESVLTDTTFRGDITMDTEARNALCAILQTCGITAIELEWLDRPTVADMVAVSSLVGGEIVVTWQDLDALIAAGIVGKVSASDVSVAGGGSQEDKNTEFRNELDALPFEEGILADTFVTVTANGAGSVPRSLRDVNSDTTNLLNFIPPSEMAAIKNRTSTYDISAPLAAAVATGKRVEIPEAGTYKLIAGYDGTTDFDVEATTSGVVFDCNGSTSQYPITNSGSLTKLEHTTTLPKKGDFEVTLSATTGISEGDWLCFYCPTDFSYSLHRPVYRAGEWVKVKEIIANVVYFEKPFTDSLEGLVIDLYKLNSVVCRINNITLDRKDGQTGVVKFALSSEASDHNIIMDAATNSVIYYDRCVQPTSYDAKGRNKGRGTDDYAISMGNSQSARVYRADIYSRRHAVALGGGIGICSVPMTDFRCYDSTLKADQKALVGGADMHGNIRHSSYENCEIHAGSNIGGGDNNWYKNCEIYSDETGVVGFGREIKGGTFGWLDCNIHISGSPRSRGRAVFDLGGNSVVFSHKTIKDVHVVINNTKIVSSNGTDTAVGEGFVFSSVRGSSVDINITIDGISSQVSPKFFSIISMSAYPADLELGSPDTVIKSKGMVVDNLVGINTDRFLRSTERGVGVYTDVPLRLMKQPVSVTADILVDAGEVVTTKATYPIQYPREPQILGHINSAGAVAKYNSLGGQPVYHMNNMLTADKAGLKVVLPLTQKFTVADTLTAKFVVGIDEI